MSCRCCRPTTHGCLQTGESRSTQPERSLMNGKRVGCQAPYGSEFCVKTPLRSSASCGLQNRKGPICGLYQGIRDVRPDNYNRPTGVLCMPRAFRRPRQRSRTPLAALRAGVVYVACTTVHAAAQPAPLFSPTILSVVRCDGVCAFASTVERITQSCHETVTSLRSAVSARFARLGQHIHDRRRRVLLPPRKFFPRRAGHGSSRAREHGQRINSAGWREHSRRDCCSGGSLQLKPPTSVFAGAPNREGICNAAG